GLLRWGPDSHPRTGARPRRSPLRRDGVERNQERLLRTPASERASPPRRGSLPASAHLVSHARTGGEDRGKTGAFWGRGFGTGNRPRDLRRPQARAADGLEQPGFVRRVRPDDETRSGPPPLR